MQPPRKGAPLDSWSEAGVKRSAQFAVLAGLFFSASLSALAQRGFPRTPGIVARPHVLMTRMPVAPMLRQNTGMISSSAGTIVTTTSSFSNSSGSFFVSGSPLQLDQLLNPAPGLGFDFVHLAAINHNLGERALIDPITQQELALAERLLRETPIEPVSFPFFEPQPTVLVEQQQPPVIIVQQPQAAAAPAPQVAAQSAPPPAEVAPPPLPDIGEFTLVLRDATRIKAVAFTRQGDRIVYITAEGLRRSFPATDLDSAATVQINDERGTPLQLPL